VVMLGRRRTAGSERIGEFGGRLAPLIAAGLLEQAGERVVPTRRGLDLHNQVALAVL